MKATGIVRRIDDLGRVVIPKEIRRTLRIREGDPLEIFTDRNGEVILKKYSPVGELSEFASEYAESINRVLGHVTCIADRDSIVAAAGKNSKLYERKPVSADLDHIMKDKKTVVVNRSDGDVIYPVVAGEENSVEYSSQVIVPIIWDGRSIGAVILLSEKPDVTMGEMEIKMAEAAAGFFGRQMEQ